MIKQITKEEEIKQQAILAVAYHDYAKVLNKHSFFRVPNRNRSEDLVQETFAKTWNYLLKGGDIEKMRAFLYHILNDLIIDEYRKRKTVSLDVLREKGFEPSIDDTKHLINILDGKAALLLINRLPEQYRQVIYMRYVKDLSLAEIADVTGLSKNVIAVRAHRGIKKFKIIYDSS